MVVYKWIVIWWSDYNLKHKTKHETIKEKNETEIKQIQVEAKYYVQFWADQKVGVVATLKI